MNISELCDLTVSNVVAGNDYVDKEICSFYTSDNISEVISNASHESCWITSLTDKEVIAASALKDFKCVLITCGNLPDEEILKHAENEKIPVLVTLFNSFQASGIIYQKINS